MFREQYAHLNQQLHPDDALVNAVIHEAQTREGKRRRSAVFLRKPLLAALCICLCTALVVPALATVEPVYQLMYQVSPTMAQFFMPVQKADEDQGIQMEVVSARIHGSTAQIYITLQDLTGDRIDPTIDLFDSYSIHRPFDSSARCERVGYEADTNTATFLITIDQWGGKEISGDKITFSVREFLSRKQVWEDIAIPMELAAVTTAEASQTVSLLGGSGSDFDWESEPAALVPAAPAPQFPVDGIDLTGLAYLDGKLHIQTAVNDPLSNDNHGFFYLKDSEGTTISAQYSFYFSNGAEHSERTDYCESVFDIPKEQLSAYTLHGSFVTSHLKTEGNWSVTFPLEQANAAE